MIVVTAPTSRIGSQVLGRLVGHEQLRVVARDPSRLGPEVRAHADVITGSHRDPEVIRAALNGAHTVFWLVPPDPHVDDVVEYYRRFTEPFCNAVAEYGVKRVVYVTTLGRGYTPAAGLLSAALAMDELIEQTGAAYRALRMPFFMENFTDQAELIKHQKAFYFPNDVDRTLLTVATRDIAAVAAQILREKSWVDRRSLPIVGPDELSPRQMAEVISGVVGWTVRAEQVPAERYKAMMTGHGLSPGFVEGLVEMAAAQDNGIYDKDAAGADRAATGFSQWCRDSLSHTVANVE